MEEKEIYEVISPSLNGYAYIHDFKTDNVLNTYDSCDLLNQQSKRIKELEKENQQLKQQLAEKDEEIAYLTKQVKKFNNEAQKYFEDAYCNDFHNQEKISFALEQLEKVKNEIIPIFCVHNGIYSNLHNEVFKTIDNQINVLRNNKDGIH